MCIYIIKNNGKDINMTPPEEVEFDSSCFALNNDIRKKQVQQYYQSPLNSK